ncbi:DUF1543 domain-containing protein [Chitinophaga agrisoli]|uniref:DUF1543 domain-containing protein n=1 Tax=Chitinophaga agrisoli TaxID=2607653 RepID=A0A5B2VUL3_9BACT|nr:DUF1543 domain-containing protein [Chitinophaga agrisoli]KAA2242765.1 DUF1543 domain-containing protein [Chitinophaga agrisoli]
MVSAPKLYMLLLGCKPNGRHTEQHDIFFSIGLSLKDLVPAILEFWPEAAPKIHIDAWREVTAVNGYVIRVASREAMPAIAAAAQSPAVEPRLFFINLGGYKENEFEEFHYKIITVASDKQMAITQGKRTAFFKHAQSAHVDDKYGVDVDDIYDIADILPAGIKDQYRLIVTPQPGIAEDPMHMGYFRLDAL